MNILEKAKAIVYDRSEEKERQYGPFHESMIHTAQIASAILKKEVTPEEVYIIQVALKLSRECHAHKEDNMLDAIAYLASMNDLRNQKGY